MELNSEQSNGFDMISQSEFSKLKQNISLSAIDYAMDNNMVDYRKVGTIRYIVLTPRSQSYTPTKRTGNRKTVMHTVI